MIVEIVFLMIIFIALLTVIQPDKERTRISAAYAFSLFAHWFFAFLVFSDGGEFLIFTHGTLYFLSAAIVDVLFIKYIAESHSVSNLASELQMVSIVSIFYNLGGWLLYWNESHEPIYHFMFAAIYLWAIYVLTKGEPINARDKHRFIRVRNNYCAIRINDMARNFKLHNH